MAKFEELRPAFKKIAEENLVEMPFHLPLCSLILDRVNMIINLFQSSSHMNFKLLVYFQLEILLRFATTCTIVVRTWVEGGHINMRTKYHSKLNQP